MKKTLSLLLVVVMMLSVLVIPAAAAVPDGDVAEPLQFITCPRCSESARVYSSWISADPVTVKSCEYSSTQHTHSRFCTVYILECPGCGNFQYKQYTGRVTCDASGNNV